MNNLVFGGFVAIVVFFSVADAVNNCWFCDINNNDCKNPTSWTVRSCNYANALGNDTPCFKVGKTGNRGCVSAIAACTTSNNIKDYEFDWGAPWLWVWNQILPTYHDCFSQSHGCHDFFCCRDQDRCNSAEINLPLSTPIAIGTVVLPIAIAALAAY